MEIEFVAKLKSIADGTYAEYEAQSGKNKGTSGIAFGSDKGTIFLSRKLTFPNTDEKRIPFMKKLNVYKIVESNTLVAAEGMSFTTIKDWE